MTELVVLVPVLRRPHRVRPLLESARGTTPEARVCFIPDPDDAEEKVAIEEHGGEILLEMNGGWAAKLNRGIQATDEPLIFLGADDLDFRPGWYEAASRLITDKVGLVGVNDLIRRRREHTTHFLMARWYAQLPTMDGRPGPLTEAYHHSFTDDELIGTAKKRGAYAYAEDALVEHLHPFGGTGVDDEIYRLGRQQFRQDRALFHRRQHLWT